MAQAILLQDVETLGERLDDRLRPVEVPVLGAPRAARDRVGAQTGHELAGFRGGDDA